jgi:predicted transcriptional regulator
VPGELDALLSFDTREVVAALREMKRLRTVEVADRIGLSRPATLKRLNAMKQARLVEWVREVAERPACILEAPSEMMMPALIATRNML